MREIDLVRDADFLRKLDNQKIKTVFTKVIILDWDENIIQSVEGRVSGGSISIQSSGNPRRSGSLAFVADNNQFNDITDLDSLFSASKKIKVIIGVQNNVDKNYDDIIWFNQGIFVITLPSITHNTSTVTINLQFQDKICLLNGSISGTLPASVNFKEYDQINEDGTVTYDVPQRYFDILLTLVANYGKEPIENIFINDVGLELKSLIHMGETSTKNVWFNPNCLQSVGADGKVSNAYSLTEQSGWTKFEPTHEYGYKWIDFVVNKSDSLVSSIGETVTSILDKIVSGLGGNYEYFYDVDGKFIFQEIKNYLNTTYEPIKTLKIDEVGNNGEILNNTTYVADFTNGTSSIYTFDQGSALISSYTNSPDFTNIKNDYHIWGKLNDIGNYIHYHVAIKEKPLSPYAARDIAIVTTEAGDRAYLWNSSITGSYVRKKNYVPNDWRAELYLQGLEKIKNQIRPDIYEQEILDLFDNIWDWKTNNFKDIVDNSNQNTYWIDYIDPIGLQAMSVDNLGTRMYSKDLSSSKIKKLFNEDVPNIVLIDKNDTNKQEIIDKCKESALYWTLVDSELVSAEADGVVESSYCNTAQEQMRNLLYQYSIYPSGISLTSIPIYYLNTNSRITVKDDASGINGDYIISAINLPLDGKSTMSITASKALERV